jgi:transposase-like protein
MEALSMSRNPIQFQRGLSMADFRNAYDDEDRCWEALRKARWPGGFACPNCGGGKYSFLKPTRLFQCSACGKQTSVRAGTIFHHSKLPLRTWFLAIYCLTQTKNSVAALELMRILGVQYNTAWLMKQKIMQVMHERNEKTRLEGRIEMDDAYLGGEKEGKPGREARTSSLSSPPSRRVRAGRSVCNFAVSTLSQRLRSCAMRRRASRRGRRSSAMGCPVSRPLRGLDARMSRSSPAASTGRKSSRSSVG